MDDLLTIVRDFIKQRDLWGWKFVVACSGGADSMALLDLMRRLSAEPRLLGVCVAHLNHGIRGADADADAELVRRYCVEHEISHRVGHVDVPAYARERKLSLETAARECRYDFLIESASEFHTRYIATAHHADDQAETVLMRILRGTGLDGLAGIRPVREDGEYRIVRPLLTVRRADLERYCAENGVPFRHDATNDATEATRNRIRLDLMPKLERDYNPAVTDALCRLASLANEQRGYLDEEIRKCYGQAVRKDTIQRDGYKPLPRVLRMGVLRRIIAKMSLVDAFGREHYELLDRFVLESHAGKRLTLPRGLLAVNAYGKIVLRCGGEDLVCPPKRFADQSVKVPGVTRWGDNTVITVAPTDDPHCSGRDKIVVDADATCGRWNWQVRCRRPGDRIDVNGGTQTVKQLMIDRKVPRSERGLVPIIEVDGRIIWVAGVRQGDFSRPKAGNKRLWLVALTQGDNEQGED